MTLAIVVFNFFPLTAIMIVMLALLNDGAICRSHMTTSSTGTSPRPGTCACPGYRHGARPCRPECVVWTIFPWRPRSDIDRPQIQTMMYLLLSVAGHLTIFQTRTRGPWWSIRPAWILLAAVVGTQILATMICVFGLLVAPLWWGWAAMVWGYALVWFLATRPVKLLAYRLLDPGAGGTATSVSHQAPGFNAQALSAPQ